MKIKCSIIIPVYNCDSAVFDRCMKSLENLPQDFEAIIVNDGSNDELTELINRYDEPDGQIHVINQPNQGVSAARNTGISESCGEWVVFCDADDYLEIENLKRIVDGNPAHADFIYTDYSKNQNDTVKQIQLKKADSSGEYINMLLCEPNIYGTVWAKIFNKNVLLKKNVRFKKDLSHAEDSVFLLEYLINTDTVYKEGTVFYQYYVYGSSAAKKNTSAVENYLLSLGAVKDILQKSNMTETDNYYSFCNTNLLIMLVNYIFPEHGKYADGKDILAAVLSNPLLQESLNNYQTKKTGFANNIVLQMLKHKLYYPAYIAASVRRILR